jgi:hypothetical protein
MGELAYRSDTDSVQTPYYAAGLANNLIYREFTDWYIPSIEEWQQIALAVHEARLGNFLDRYYWSSTEFSGDSLLAYNVVTNSALDFSRGLFLLVRPVRSF